MKLNIINNLFFIFDFDKTISLNDMVVDILDVCGITGWREMEKLADEGKITPRECIYWELQSINADRHDFQKAIRDMLILDDGTKKIFDWIRENKIPMQVISDGLEEIINYVFNDLDYGKGIDYKIDAHRLIWDDNNRIKEVILANDPCEHGCANCKVSKVEIIKKNNPDKKIVYVGDGFTDLRAAIISDIIFARKDHMLSKWCIQNNKAHHIFNSLDEIINHFDGSESA